MPPGVSSSQETQNMPKGGGKSKTKAKKTKGPRKQAVRSKGILDSIKRMSVGDVMDFGYNAFNAAGRLMALNSEVKFVDTSFAGTVNYTGAVTPVALIAEGDTVNQRGGESVRAHGLEIRVHANYNASAPDNSVRFMVVVDAETIGAAPATSDILETVGVAGAYTSPWNHLGAPRFDVVYDDIISVGLSPTEAVRTISIPLKHHVRFNGAGGAIGQAREGQVYIVQVGSQNVNLTNLNWQARFHYVDN